MPAIHLDGVRLEIGEGSPPSSSVFPHPPEGCCVAIIRPATKEQAKTASLAITTTAGEVTVEMTGQGSGLLESPEIAGQLAIHWSDRYAAAFGPFPSAIRPIRTPHLYERGDVILGCGGYDPKRSYLLLSKTRHAADHGS